jgi:anthranilate phosphoribosyltransferase
VLADLTSQVRRHQALAPEEIAHAVSVLVDGTIPPEPKAEFLIALSIKGESTSEIAAFARELRERSLPVPIDPSLRSREILDVCGTGGDRLGTFNISTTVGLVCAAAGVVVAKHGNRAITSKSGSADVLAALGIPVEQTPTEAARSLERHNFAFLFAPFFQPAFRAISPARKLCAEQGQRTIFNFLGPLLNPVRPSAQLIGVSRSELVGPLAEVSRALGTRRSMVVAGEVPDGGTLDEFSTLGLNHVAEFYQDRGFHQSVWSPSDFPLQTASLSDLEGGDAVANAQILRNIVSGTDRGPKRDAVLLNAGAALFVAGAAKSIVEGWDLAATTIDSGRVIAKLAALTAKS